MKEKIHGNQKHAVELPTYFSMGHMEGATGIPKSALKHAKNNGCEFIRTQSKYSLAIFLKWWFAQDQDASEDWGKRDKRASALTRELKLQEARGNLLDADETETFIRDLVGVVFFGNLDRLAHELPVILKGKNEVEIHTEMIKQVEQIKEMLKSKLAEWKET